MFNLVFRRLPLAASIVLMLAPWARAQDVVIPSAGSEDANNATHNISDVIDTLRARGFIKRARQLDKLLSDGRLSYRPTGEHAGDAQTIHKDAMPDGQVKMYLGLHSITNDGLDNLGEPQRYTGQQGEYRLYRTVLTVLHELRHADQDLSYIQSGGLNEVANAELTKQVNSSLSVVPFAKPVKIKLLPVVHEIDSYRTSMKQFAEVFVVADIGDYVKDQGSTLDADKAVQLAKLEAKVDALASSLDAPINYGDRQCRWKALRELVDKLFEDLRALRRDAESRAECSEDAAVRKKNETAAAQRVAQLTDAIKRRVDTLKPWRGKLVASRQERSRLDTELLKSGTLQDRRLEIAERLGVLNTYLRLEAPRYKDLLARHKAELAERLALRTDIRRSRGIRAALRTGFDNCRVRYVTQAIANGDFPASELPPDMTMNANGTVGLLPANTVRPVDIAASANTIGAMFDFDPDALKENLDMRTPCYTPPKAVARPVIKQKCTGGGLLGTMNCVTTIIDGE